MAEPTTTATPTTTTPKRIKVSFAVNKGTDNAFINRVDAVLKGLDGNTNFLNLPVSLADLRTNRARYGDLITVAMDGSKKAIAERRKLRHIIHGQLRQLAAYVEVASNGDMAVFLSSGFDPVPPRGGSQPLAQPKVQKIAHGNRGQLIITFTPVRNARHYDLQYAPMVNSQPGPWIKEMVAKARPAPVISNLTPGTIYAFQIRAYGVLGYTEYSDSAIFMAT